MYVRFQPWHFVHFNSVFPGDRLTISTKGANLGVYARMRRLTLSSISCGLLLSSRPRIYAVMLRPRRTQINNFL